MKRSAPGYRDAHTHLSAGACDLLDLDLREVASGAVAAARIAEAHALRPANAWVRGWGYSAGSLPPEALPEDRPVFVARGDGHAGWASAAALAILGVPARPDGFLAEEIFDRARRRLPEPSGAARDAAIAARVEELTRLGYDEVDDVVEAWGPEAWVRLFERDLVPIRVGLWLPDETAQGDAEAIRRAIPDGAGPLAVRGIKIFLDGTLGARTAALAEDYADAPGERGALRLQPAEFHDRVQSWACRGWPLAVHALGDRAVTIALDALEAASPPAWGRHRIEHAQVVRPADLARFGAARVVASLQPGHFEDDRPWLASRLGDRPSVLIHPLGSFLRAGVEVLFGSDWPVSTWAPERILEAASGPARGPERISPDEAIRLLASRSSRPPA